MSDISEQEPSKMIGELSKALSSEVGKTESVSKHWSKTDTIPPAEKKERSVNKSPSCEINTENDLKTTILNLSKQIQELKQQRLSTSFQDHRLYSNLDALGLENGLLKSYDSHSQRTKRLRSQVYTKKTKYCSNICSPSYDSQISSYESSSEEEYNYFQTINSRKGKYNSHQSHKKHKKLTSPMKGTTSPVKENISPMREQCKSPVREGQSPVRLTPKTGKKRQVESNDSEKEKI